MPLKPNVNNKEAITKLQRYTPHSFVRTHS